MESASKIVASRSTSNEEEQSRDGSLVVLVADWEGGATRRPCLPALWVPVALAAQATSEVALAEASEVGTVADSVVASEIAAAEASVLAVMGTVVVVSATAEATGTMAARTAPPPRMHQMALGAVAMAASAAVTTDAAVPDTVVGMAVTVVVAHMTTDRAAASVVAIAILDLLAAIWSLSDPVATVVGIAMMAAAAETMTGRETMTTESAATKAEDTKNRGRSDATHKTTYHGVLWWVSRLSSFVALAPLLLSRR